MNDSLTPGPLAVRRVGRVLTYRKAATVALLFPPAGVPAFVHSVRAARLAHDGNIEAARREGERARDWSWYAVGIGLAVYVIAFIVWLLTANH
ncbi:MAG: CD225/dispanin family protein, partial [Ilumatobacteraceae bacterium]